MEDVRTWLRRSSASLSSGATMRAVQEAREAFLLAVGRDEELELASMESLGTALWSRGEAHHASLVLGAAHGLRERTHRTTNHSLDELAQSSSGWDEGIHLTPEEVAVFLTHGRDRRGNPTAGWASLTPSERQVVELAAEGLTNPSIARKLFISTNTVKTHLQRAYRKLGVTSRGDLSQARR